MANKPAQICQLEKDKLIDTQKGFVDTFNWAVQSIANLKGGENCEVSWPTDDTPTIDCNSSESESGGSGGGECACDLQAELTSGVKIAQWTKDGTNWTDIYCLSSGGGCDCDLQAVLTSGTKIAQWTKDGTTWTDIYCLSGGGGEVSVYGTNNSMFAGSEFHFASASDSNVSVNIDSSGVMTVGVYYL